MANPNVTKKGATTLPQAMTAPATPPAGDAPAEAKNGEELQQLGKYREIFPTAEEAVKEANSRVKGPKLAFTVTTPPGFTPAKTLHVVAGNWDRAAGIMFTDMGGLVTNLSKGGRGPRAAKPLDKEGILAAAANLPEGDRQAVLEQLAKLLGQK